MRRDLLPYRITICGLTELCRHQAAGITQVLTILDPDWPDPPDFAHYAPHARTVRRFHDIVGEQEGLVEPREADVAAILDLGRHLRNQPVGHLLVHCHMGISRSTAAAAILMAQHNPGREAEAFDHLARIRPISWPNSRMVRLADRLLERRGRLVEAMRSHHARVAATYPDFAALLRTSGRAHEVP